MDGGSVHNLILTDQCKYLERPLTLNLNRHQMKGGRGRRGQWYRRRQKGSRRQRHHRAEVTIDESIGTKMNDLDIGSL